MGWHVGVEARVQRAAHGNTLRVLLLHQRLAKLVGLLLLLLSNSHRVADVLVLHWVIE